MIDERRLKILTASAKFDVSCSSSGSSRTKQAGQLGNAAVHGICHSFTPDGRCVSLLKILMTNNCRYGCLYCPNRADAECERASATPDEICELAVSFYKRNYIEGLFLSSAIEYTPDRTMELLLETVLKLRTVYHFNGYVHLKGIPNADKALIDKAAAYVDRMSLNVEFPSENSLKLLAPQKTKRGIFQPMRLLTDESENRKALKSKSQFIPAGQTTQMIIGASPESDGDIIRLSEYLYRSYKLKRVYYSSYISLTQNSLLPVKSAGLLREHRLYQADWLMRFYGFTASEIAPVGGNLPEEYDPKCAWALRNMNLFPVEINTAPIDVLLRVPGIGTRGAYKILQARKYNTLTFELLKKLRIALKRAQHFITCNGKFYGIDNEQRLINALQIEGFSEKCEQLSLFSTTENALTSITGEL